MDGRWTLIKYVLSSYPLYVMQNNLIPRSILDELDRTCKKCLWNKVDSVKYIPRTNWDTVTTVLGLGAWVLEDLRIGI